MNLLFSPKGAGSIDLHAMAIVALTACALGLLLALVRGGQATGSSRLSDVIRRVLVCAGMALATALLPGSTARALLLCGALLTSRADRTLPVLWLVGFLCGMQVPGYAALAALCAALGWHVVARQNRARPADLLVSITIPEELRAPDVFTSVLDEHTQSHTLVSMRTVELGMFIELTFLVTPRDGIDTRAFLNALRGLNGNLSVIIRQAGPPVREEAPWPADIP